MRAVIYARYSSHAQKDTSIEQQLRVCRQYAKDHDLQIADEYVDRAISGTSDKRPDFLRMIKDAAKGKWQRVLVYKVDRFARNRYDSAMYKARLKKYGVKVMSVMEPIPEGPEGILLESVLEGSAEYYSANLSQNILRGMRENALACKVNNGGLPIGLTKGPDGRYAIEPAGAEIVREIFDQYSHGKNVTQITAELNARGLRTSKGSRWNKNSLHTILKNERYAGVYIWGDVRIEGGIPAIISRDLFDDVQERIRKVARAPAGARTDVDYALTGKLFCGHCGSPMVGESGTGKSGRKFYYYGCIKRKRERACDKKPVKKDWIETEVVRLTREKILSDEVIAVIVDGALRRQEAERESEITMLRSMQSDLAEVKRGIRNIVAAIEQGIITPSTKERLDELEQRRSDLQAGIEELEAEDPMTTREELTFWLERFRDGDLSDPKFRDSFIEVFINSVYVYDDHIRIVINFTRDGGAVSYDFVNGIETCEEAEVFDFDAHASIRASVLTVSFAVSSLAFLCSGVADVDAPSGVYGYVRDWQRNVFRDDDRSNDVEADRQSLLPHTVDLFCLIDFDVVNQLVEHFRSQLFCAGVLADDGQERLLCQRLGGSIFQSLPRRFDLLGQFRLLGIIPLGHSGESFIRQLAGNVILVDALKELIQLAVSGFQRVQLFLQRLTVSLRSLRGELHDGLGKLIFVLRCEFGQASNLSEHHLFQKVYADVVRAFARPAAIAFVVGTVKVHWRTATNNLIVRHHNHAN